MSMYYPNPDKLHPVQQPLTGLWDVYDETTDSVYEGPYASPADCRAVINFARKDRD